MYKKAGIVVGVTIILIAIGLLLLANRLDAKKDKPQGIESNKVQSNNNASKPVVNNSVEVTSPKVDNTTNSEFTGDKDNGSIGMLNSSDSTSEPRSLKTKVSVIDEKTLGENFVNKEEVMYIANKKLLLIDMDVEGKLDKQLVYCLDILGVDNKPLHLYVNKVVYDTLSLGDKVAVKYTIYKNDSGIEFPSIVDVTKVE